MTGPYEAILAAYRAQFPKMTEMWARLPADDRCDGQLCFPADDPCDEWARYDMTAETLERIMTAVPEWKPRPDRLYRFYITTGDGKTASWTDTDPYRK